MKIGHVNNYNKNDSLKWQISAYKVSSSMSKLMISLTLDFSVLGIIYPVTIFKELAHVCS